jgi:hypothetical protein
MDFFILQWLFLMDEQVAKYLEMLEQSDPVARITGLDCLYTYDPRSALLENALKKTALVDSSEDVRLKSIDLIIKLFKTTSNRAMCQFLAQIVGNKEEVSSCRIKAYFAMKMVCWFALRPLIKSKKKSKLCMPKLKK